MKRLLLTVLAICSLAAGFANAQDREIRGITDKLTESLTQSGKKTVAVVDFTDLQGNVTELGRFLAEEISASLAESAKGIEVVDRTNLKVIIQENKLAATGIIDPATARKLGQIAGVDSLITGTLTPFGDTVHLSIKILDTATARIVGATRGDIPKTKAIEELLGHGALSTPQVNNGGTPTQAPAPPVPPPPPSVASGQYSNIRISIRLCQRAGEWINCFGTIVNQASGSQEVMFHSDTYMIDNLGNQSSNGNGSGSVIGSSGPHTTLEPDIPMKFMVAEKGLSDQAATVSIIFRIYTPSIGYGTLTLRSIPIQNK